MSVSLLLIRHAQAQNKSFGESDFDRSLTNEGIQQSMKLGFFLKNEDKSPDMVVSSAANRAVNTAILLGEQIGFNAEDIVKNDSLYEGSVRIFLNAINVLNDSNKRVAMIGHNPIIIYLAEYLTGEVIDSFPPSSLVEISFPFDSWKLASEKTGTIEYKHTVVI